MREWFARSIADDEELAGLFSPGSTVRTVETHHTRPYIAAHARVPDLSLLLEVLYVDSLVSRI